MDELRWIGFGTCFLVSLVVGIRLLLLARRTGQLPELLIGVAVLSSGPLGYGLCVVAFVTAGRATILSATLQGSGFLAVSIGAAAQYLFVWYVFHRREGWARALVYLVVVLLAASYVGDVLVRGLVNRTSGGGWFWAGMVLRLAATAWLSLESLRYWGRMRRRGRLGLADPIVTNRFFLWGAGSGVALLGSVLLVVLVAVRGLSLSQIPTVNLIVSLHGLVAAVAMWLAFQPPARYLRFLERRGALRAAAIS